MSVKISKYTKDQAKAYADNEADIYGFAVGSPKWQKAFKDYLSESYSTMAVGRNPRPGSHKYKVIIGKYPEIFGEEGFAGRVAKSYKTTSGEGIPLDEVQNRIMSTVMNLVKVFENGIMGTLNTTKTRKQGKIENEAMSELQMPNRKEFKSDDDFKAAKRDVIYNWFQRDILVDAVLEFLLPFFKMKKAEIESVLDKIVLDETDLDGDVNQGRADLVSKLRSIIEPQMNAISYLKLLSK